MSGCRVMLVSDMSKPWNNSWYYKVGLEENGHEVLMVDPLTLRSDPGRLIGIVKTSKPDFVLHTKKEIPASVFQDVRKHARVIQWYPDPVTPDWLTQYVEASDVFFTMSEGLVDVLRQYNPNVFYLSQAFEPSFFEVGELTGEDRRVYEAQVTFVGNLGSKPQYVGRRKYLERIVREGFHLKWWGPRLPRKLSTLGLIFGKLGRAYGGRFVWGREYAKVARLSKVFLAFDSIPHLRKSMSARMYTAVGCGAFYLCQHVEGIEDVYEPDRELVTFRTEDEMLEKIRFYLARDGLRHQIAERGRQRTLRDHTYTQRMREMFRVVANGL